MINKGKKYFIKTYGCQMNVSDSERINGWYESRGWKLVEEIEKADEVVINSCSVRESAENRVFGLINNLNKLPRKPKIVLTGCMLRYPLKWLQEKLPEVDEFKKISEFTQGLKFIVRNSTLHAWVPIMEGCNNFCTYCVVPTARGREVSRPFEEIVCEVRQLVCCGYKEITLLGQNVNSYGKDFPGECISVSIREYNTPFALLLATLNKITGIKKISFMTSNPWDLDEEIIKAMSLPKIDRYLHLAVQSGDDEILGRMNRKYTAKQFMELVRKIKEKVPEIRIGTDIIVGFPGETEEQFQNTVDLCKKIGFEKAYVSIYSPRPGTAAYKLKDNVPHKEKRRRWRVLEELINQ